MTVQVFRRYGCDECGWQSTDESKFVGVVKQVFMGNEEGGDRFARRGIPYLYCKPCAEQKTKHPLRYGN